MTLDHFVNCWLATTTVAWMVFVVACCVAALCGLISIQMQIWLSFGPILAGLVFFVGWTLAAMVREEHRRRQR